MSEKIGFVGLGSMGSAMAANILAAGYALRVYNRTADKAKPLVEQGATQAQTPGGTAEPGGIVVSMLTNDKALEEVTLGRDGLAEALGQGGIHLSMSTVSPDTARRLAEEHEKRGSVYLAAPVFGKPDAAESRRLWIAVSGNAAAKERVRPVLETMGQGVQDFGDDAGAASLVKLTGNFLFGATIEALGEAYTLAQKGGVSRQAVHEFFTQTLFACPAYQNYGKMIASGEYQPVGATPSLIRKDFGLILAESQKSQAPMPLASLIHDRLTTLVAKGKEDQDWAGFAGEISENAGLSQ